MRVYPLYGMSLRVARTIMKDEEEAKNMVQDVFEILWKKRENLGEPKQIRSYVYSVTYHRCIDTLRSVTRTTGHVERYGRLQAFATGELFEPSDDYLRLLELVSELPPALAMVFQLRGIEGYEFSEVATILGVDEVNVRVYLSRARQMIKEKLKNNNLYENGSTKGTGQAVQ